MKPQAKDRLWLPNFAPRKGLALTAFVSLTLLSAAVSICLQAPSLGIVWGRSQDNKGLIIQKAAHGVPISPGTRVAAMRAQDGTRLTLHNGMLIQDPDRYATYAAYNAFFNRQRVLMALLSQRFIILVGYEGREWPLKVQRRRPLIQLPISFWILNLSATICLLIGCGVWCYRRGEIIGRLMAVVATNYFLSTLCLSVYSSRELAINSDLFQHLSAANHLFTIAWSYSLLLMFACYPTRIIGAKTITAAYLIILAIWLNQTFQWVEVSLHAYYMLNHLAPYAGATIIGGLQWRRTTHRPVDRASLRWFFLSIWISIGVSVALFIGPALTRHFGAIPLWMPAMSILLMFICFALGILRYGLFNLERWWFTGWVWLLSGILITGIDIVLGWVLNVGIRTLLPYSIFLLGWIYFPLRQWLWRRLVSPEGDQLAHHLPALIHALFQSCSVQAFIDQWSELLKKVYQPLNILIEQGNDVSVATRQHGLILQIPGIDGCHHFRLVGNHQGSRLFGQKDVELAKGLLDLSNALYAITNRTREVQQKGAAGERERIMRDLHDDVLPKLIAIKQQSPTRSIAKLAEAAFQSIRETIYILRYPSDLMLAEALADWRIELAERLASTRLKLHWEVPDNVDNHQLTSLQFVNCGRILREAVSNIIRHAGAEEIHIEFSICAKCLHMSISDNGQGMDTIVRNGLGTHNMKLRARSLNGEIIWLAGSEGVLGSEKGLTVKVSFPIEG